MNKFGAALIISSCFIGNLNAQAEPPPPPPPLIWQAPLESEIKRYSNSKHGFSVEFPGAPEVTDRSFDIMNYYTVRRGGSTMWVRVISFTKEDLEKVSNEEIIRQVKAAHSSYGKFKIVDVVNERSDAIEYSATDKLTFRRVNARIVNGKLFELYIDVTNWHILQDNYPEKAKAFNQEADRFFRSFLLLK